MTLILHSLQLDHRSMVTPSSMAKSVQDHYRVPTMSPLPLVAIADMHPFPFMRLPIERIPFESMFGWGCDRNLNGGGYSMEVPNFLGMSIHEHGESKYLYPCRYQFCRSSALLVKTVLHIPSIAQQRQPALPQESWPY